jgi:hypothetical protein
MNMISDKDNSSSVNIITADRAATFKTETQFSVKPSTLGKKAPDSIKSELRQPP